MAGKNDLNVALKVRLNTTNETIRLLKRDIDIINGKLDDKPIKLKVRLDATVKQLQDDLRKLQLKIQTSKTLKPIKLDVQINSKGVTAQLKSIDAQTKKNTKTTQQQTMSEKQSQTVLKDKFTLLKQIKQLEQSMASSSTTQKTLKETKALVKQIDTLRDYELATEKIAKARANLAGVQGIKVDVNLDKQISDMTNKIGKSLIELKNLGSISQQDFISQQKKWVTDSGHSLSDLQEHYKELAETVKKTRIEVGKAPMNVNSEMLGGMKNSIDNNDINSLKRYISELYKADVSMVKVTSSANELGNKVDKLQFKVKNSDNSFTTYTADLNRATNGFTQTSKTMQKTVTHDITLLEQLKSTLKRLPAFLLTSSVFYGAINGLRSVATEIIKVDTALTELRRVADSSISIDRMLGNAVDLSKELGNNIHDVLASMGELARTFGDFNERQLTDITRTSILMSNVSDLNAQQSTESIVATMNAYNISAEKTIGIVDSLNEVDNQYAISTMQLAQSMKNGSSTAKTFGVSLEELIGHTTAIGAVTMESGEAIGRGLKTIYSRITTLDKAKTGLKEIGIEITKIGKNGQEDVKPVSDILGELANKWFDLTDMQRQNIGVTLAGRNQLNRLTALMNNWDMSIQATNTALSSQGSAVRENEEYLKSYEARIEMLKNGFTEMALAMGEAMINSSLSIGIEGLTDLANGITKVVEKVGLLPVVFGGVGMFVGTLKSLTGETKLAETAIGLLGISMENTWMKTGSISKTLGSATSGIKSMIAELGIGTVVATGFKTALTSIAIGTGIGIAIALIGVAIEKLISKFQKAKELADEVKKTNEKLVDSYRNTTDGLGNLITEYDKLNKDFESKKIKEGTDEWQRYLEVNKEISEALPTMVKYVDEQGIAHMNTTEAMRRELKIAIDLSNTQAELTKLEFAKNIEETTTAIVQQAESLVILKRDQEEMVRFADQHKDDKGLAFESLYGSDKKIQENKIKQINAYQEIQKSIALIGEETESVILASLEMEQILNRLSETERAVVENFNDDNKKFLQSIYDQFEKGEIDKKELKEALESTSAEMVEAGERLGRIMNESKKALISEAVKGIEGDKEISRITEKLQGDIDALYNALPKDFFNMRDINNEGEWKTLKSNIQGVVDVATDIQGGATNLSELSRALQATGLSADEAEDVIKRLSVQFDNQGLRTQFATEELQEYIETTLETIDVTKELFGLENDTISNLEKRFEVLEALRKTNLEDSELESQMQKDIALAFNKTTDEVSKNYGSYKRLVTLLGDYSTTLDENGNLSKEQIGVMNEIDKLLEKLGLDGEVINAVLNENTGAVGENTKEVFNQKEAISELNKKYEEYKANMSEETRSAYLDSIGTQLTKIDGDFKTVRDNNGNLRLEMSDGSSSEYLSTINEQLKNAGLKIESYDSKTGELKIALDDGSGSTFLKVLDTEAGTAGDTISETTKQYQGLLDLNKPGSFGFTSNIKYDSLGNTLDGVTEKSKIVNSRLLELQSLATKLQSDVGALQFNVDIINNTALVIKGRLSGLDSASASVLDLKNNLDIVKNKIDNLFKGFEANTFANSLNNINTKIRLFGSDSLVALAKYNNLRSILSIPIPYTGVVEYYKTLNKLNQSLVNTTTRSLITASAQSIVLSAFSKILTVVTSYNRQVEKMGSGVSNSFNSMSKSVIKAVVTMITQYVKNVSSVKAMKDSVNRLLDNMVDKINNTKRLSVTAMSSMGTQMKKEFVKKISEIVEEAKKLPGKIGKGITDNMYSSSSVMTSVAKDMVKKFKKELGINSPSKVFQDLGGYIIQGLANGLTGSDLKSLGKDVFSDFGGGVFDSWDMIKSFITGDFNNVAGSGVQRWAGLATKALQMTGQLTPENLNRLLYQMQTESGGNPMAQNNWDSNAKKGTPSKGLMQVIDPTFKAYKMPGYNNIWSPLDNILASIRYAVSRYGSLAKAYRGVGYADGGFIDKEHLAMVGEKNKREVVIPLEQNKNRAIELWTQAGGELGLLDLINKHKNSGMGSSIGSMGASSGDGGGESGSSGTGTSGIIQPSIYEGGITSIGDYAIQTSELSPVEKPNYTQRESTIYGGEVNQIKGQMERLVQLSVSYRNSLNKIIELQEKINKNNKKELTSLEERNKAINKRLSALSNTSKHTEAQRNEYNDLQREYNSNLSEIASLKGEIETTANDIRSMTTEILTNMIDEIIDNYNKAIDKIVDRIDDIDFELDVLSLTDPDNIQKQTNLLVNRVTEIVKQQQELKNLQKEMNNQLAIATSRYGANSEEVKKIKEELSGVEESIEDVTLEILKTEKEVKDIRADVVDDSIDMLKTYYKEANSMLVNAIDLEKDKLETAHDEKMDMYDEEIAKINSVYDEKLDKMDKEKTEQEYQSKLNEQNERKTKLTDKMRLLSLDSSAEGRKKLADVQTQLSELELEQDQLIKERKETLLKEQIEAQKQMEIDSITAKKEAEDIALQEKLTKLETEKEAINTFYSEILNNDQYWATMRDEFIKGNFNVLSTEMAKMKDSLAQLDSGVFESLTTGFTTLSDTVQSEILKINDILIDNLTFQAEDVFAKLEQLTEALRMEQQKDQATSTQPTPKPTPIPTTPAPAPAPTPTPPSNNSGSTNKTPKVGGKVKVSASNAKAYKDSYGKSANSWAKQANSAGVSYGQSLYLVNSQRGYGALSKTNNIKGAIAWLKLTDLVGLKTGGYTGNNEGVAMLHKKELVLNEGQTSNILDTAKIMDKIASIIPMFKTSNIADKLVSSGNTNTSVINNYDVNLHIDRLSGTKKDADMLSTEIIKGLKKKGR